jgi:hypothetical protein
VRWNNVHYEDITGKGGYDPVVYNVARESSVWSVADSGDRRPLKSCLVLHVRGMPALGRNIEPMPIFFEDTDKGVREDDNDYYLRLMKSVIFYFFTNCI